MEMENSRLTKLQSKRVQCREGIGLGRGGEGGHGVRGDQYHHHYYNTFNILLLRQWRMTLEKTLGWRMETSPKGTLSLSPRLYHYRIKLTRMGTIKEKPRPKHHDSLFACHLTTRHVKALTLLCGLHCTCVLDVPP